MCCAFWKWFDCVYLTLKKFCFYNETRAFDKQLPKSFAYKMYCRTYEYGSSECWLIPWYLFLFGVLFFILFCVILLIIFWNIMLIKHPELYFLIRRPPRRINMMQPVIIERKILPTKQKPELIEIESIELMEIH